MNVPKVKEKLTVWTPAILLSIVVTLASGGMWVINDKIANITNLYQKDISSLREIMDLKLAVMADSIQKVEKHTAEIAEMLKQALLIKR